MANTVQVTELSLLCKYEYCLFALARFNVNQHLDFCMLQNTTDIDILLEYQLNGYFYFSIIVLLSKLFSN